MSELVDRGSVAEGSSCWWAGVNRDFVQPLLAACDVLVILIASLVGNVAYQVILQKDSDVAFYVGIGIFASVGYLLAAHYFRLYQLQEYMRPRVEYDRIFICWLVMIFLLTLFFFLMKIGADVSRASIVSFSILALPSLTIWRGVSKKIVRAGMASGAIRGRRALILGTLEELQSLSQEHLLQQHGIAEAERLVLSSPCLDRVDFEKSVRLAGDIARSIDVDEVLVSLPWGDSRSIEIVRESFRLLPLRVRLVADRFVRSLTDGRSSDEIPLINIVNAPLSQSQRVLKRAFDVIGASIVILTLSPVMTFAAIGVRLESPGPVIFRQRRKGFNGKEFIIYKFRTMKVLEDGDKITQATKHDPRVTKIGGFLRRSSIDELPQLFNVLQGSMSLIGPRPHPVALDNEYERRIGRYAFRHHVKPGITGLAQVSGFRGETKQLDLMKRRIELDIEYVDTWSFWQDIRILIRTISAVISSPNAY